MESSPKDKQKSPTYYYETSDLILIALIAALGGVFSTFIGYLASLAKAIIGIPKIGQIFAGLHIFWFVLVFLLTNRKVGSAILSGIIKGFVELFSASHLGIMVLYVSAGEAIVFEIVFFSMYSLLKTQRLLYLEIAIASGFAAVSNIIFQINVLLGSALPIEFLMFIILLCFVSGVGFGGYLGLMLFELFQRSNLLNWRNKTGLSMDLSTKQEKFE